MSNNILNNDFKKSLEISIPTFFVPIFFGMLFCRRKNMIDIFDGIKKRNIKNRIFIPTN